MSDLIDLLLAARTEDVPKCAICAAGGVRDERWSRLLCLPSPFGVLRCTRCTLRWLSPRPTAKGYDLLYSDRHYFMASDLPGYAGFAAQRRSLFRSRMRRLKRTGAIQSILDFGAATGEFVAIARDEGIRAEGIEFSRDAREAASAKLGITLFSPAELNKLPEQFDAIHMNHVLEHMPDPAEHLRWCSDRLASGGTIIIEVPNQFDNDADRLRRAVTGGGRQARFDAFSVHHTYFFSPRSLMALVRQAGFDNLHVRTTVTQPSGNLSVKRRLLGAALNVANRLHHGGDAIELWARRA